MKNRLIILILFLTYCSCYHNNTKENKVLQTKDSIPNIINKSKQADTIKRSVQKNDIDTVKKDTQQINQIDVHGRKQGTWKRYYPDGKISEIRNYLNDSLNGAYMSYYNSGTIQVQGFYKSGTIINDFKHFYPDGKIKSLWHNNDKGMKIFYNEYGKDGRLTYEDIYKNEKLSATIMYINGKYDTMRVVK